MQSLYVIYGEEDLTRFEALDTLRAESKKEGAEERELFVAEGNFKWQEIDGALESLNLFAAKKLVEIQVPSGKPGRAGSDYLAALPKKLRNRGGITVIVFLPKLERSALQSKWFRALKENAKLIEAKALPRERLPAWIGSRLEQENLKIDPAAAALFAERMEGNLLAARGEIEKMALLYPAGTTLGLKEIEEAISDLARFDVFQLNEAWMQGDVTRLVKLLGAMDEQDFEPTLLLWLLSEDIRTLIRLMGAKKQGKNVQSLRYELRLWGNKLGNGLRAISRLSARDLMSALQDCARIDRELKGIAPGDARASLKNLFLTLAGVS